MAYFDVEESFYFEQKLAQLKALDPALYSNWEVAQVQDAFTEAGLSAQEHFDQYGWAEELSANATFDVAKYLAAKAAQLNEAAYEGKTDWTSADVVAAFQAAGLSAEAHFTQYGEAEGLEAQPVEGAPSTLTEALANLKAAEDAKTAFLKANFDEDEGDVELSDTEGRIKDSLSETDALLANTTATGYGDFASKDAAGNTVVYSADDTETVKQAKLADELKALQKNLTDAEEKLAKEEAKIASNAKLVAALKNQESRTDSYTAAEKATAKAESAEAGAEAALISLGHDTTGSSVSDADFLALFTKTKTDTDYLEVIKTVKVGDTITGVKGKVSADLLALAADYVNAYNARVDAEANQAQIFASLQKAKLAVYMLDVDLDAEAIAAASPDPAQSFEDLLDAIASETASTTDTGKTLTYEGLQKALTDALAAARLEADEAKADLMFADLTDTTVIATVTPAAVDSDAEAYNDLADLVNAFFAEVDTADLQLSTAVTNAQTAKSNAAKALATFEDLLAQRTEAQTSIDELKTLEDAIEAAEKVFVDLGFEAPVKLVESQVAGEENDLYLVGTADVSIINFGVDGNDSIFVGSNYVLNKGTDVLKDGDDAVLEVFFIQAGNNTQIHVETKAYGSSEKDVAETIITLTGVKAADLTLTEDGFVTLA